MSFKFDDPVYIDERFCSLEIFVPTQLQEAEGGFELMANAWFGTIRQDFETASGVRSITVGLQSATLMVETCKNSRMRPGEENKLRSEALKLTYTGSTGAEATSGRGGAVSGRVSAILWQKILSLEAEGDLSARKSQTATEQTAQDATFDVFEIHTASPHSWSIKALNPARPLDHLNGPEVRGTLCIIDTETCRSEVTARLVIEPRDLWLEVNEGSVNSALENAANERAVLAVLMNKAVEEKSLEQPEGGLGDERAVVAESKLRRTPKRSS